MVYSDAMCIQNISVFYRQIMKLIKKKNLSTNDNIIIKYNN